MPRKYEKVQELYPAIKEILEAGKTQREVAKHFGLKDKKVVGQLLNRERCREAKAQPG